LPVGNQYAPLSTVLRSVTATKGESDVIGLATDSFKPQPPGTIRGLPSPLVTRSLAFAVP
jgi:hypothetical protein